MEQLQSRSRAEYAPIEARFDQAFEQRKEAAAELAGRATRGRSGASAPHIWTQYPAGAEGDQRRAHARRELCERLRGEKGFNDTNYIFLSFVTRYLPAGVVGLMIAVIFAAAMSSISGEINSLATVTVIDIYQRHVRQNATDHHYLWPRAWPRCSGASYAVVFAQYGQELRRADRSREHGGIAVLWRRCWACSCWRSASSV